MTQPILQFDHEPTRGEKYTLVTIDLNSRDGKKPPEFEVTIQSIAIRDHREKLWWAKPKAIWALSKRAMVVVEWEGRRISREATWPELEAQYKLEE